MPRVKICEALASVEDNVKYRGGLWCPQALIVFCTRDGPVEGSFNTYTVYCIQLQDPNNLDPQGKPVLLSLKYPRILQWTIMDDKKATRFVFQQETTNSDGRVEIVNWILKMSLMKPHASRCSPEDYEFWKQVRFYVFIAKTSFLNTQSFFF